MGGHASCRRIPRASRTAVRHEAEHEGLTSRMIVTQRACVQMVPKHWRIGASCAGAAQGDAQACGVAAELTFSRHCVLGNLGTPAPLKQVAFAQLYRGSCCAATVRVVVEPPGRYVSHRRVR
jgi:hypothetical protein